MPRYIRAEVLVFLTLWLGSSITVASPLTSLTSTVATTQRTNVSSGTPGLSDNKTSATSIDTPSTNQSLSTSVTDGPVQSSPSTSVSSTSSTQTTPITAIAPFSMSSTVQGKTTLSAQQSTIALQKTTEAGNAGFTVWQGVSIGLGGLCFLIALAFILSIAVLCRLRGQLRRVNKTLYPSSMEEHVYAELKSSDQKSGKKKNPVKVELQNLRTSYIENDLHEDEIHSPMSPEPSMASPFTGVTSSASIDSNQPPPLKDRKMKVPPSAIDVSRTAATEDDDVDHVYENEGFDGQVTDLYANDDNDNVYEDYTDFAFQNLNRLDGVGMESSKSSTKPNDTSPNHKQIRRENSMSGLPESVLQRVSSQLGADGMPLQDIDEDSPQCLDSGIPMGDATDKLKVEPTVRDDEQNLTMDDVDGVGGKGIDSNNPKASNAYDSKNERSPKANDHKRHAQHTTNANNTGDRLTGDIALADGIPSSGVQIEADQIYSNQVDDLQPLYDDGDIGIQLVDIDDEIPIYEDGDSFMSPPFADDQFAGQKYGNHQVDLPDSTTAQFPTSFPDIGVIHDQQSIASEGPETNQGQTVTQSSPKDVLAGTKQREMVTETSHAHIIDGNSTASHTDLDPLGMLSRPIRLRSDSSSTPDSYYLDLEDVTPVLKVENSKRVSSQFPREFYVKNVDSLTQSQELGTYNRFETTASNEPFNDNVQTGQTDEHVSPQGTLHGFDNEIYANLVQLGGPDSFDNESTT